MQASSVAAFTLQMCLLNRQAELSQFLLLTCLNVQPPTRILFPNKTTPALCPVAIYKEELQRRPKDAQHDDFYLSYNMERVLNKGDPIKHKWG